MDDFPITLHSAPDLVGEREPWMDDAACAEVGGDLWFPEKGGSTKDAKRICGGCDVREQCLEYAIRTEQQFGIWGGVAARALRRMRKDAA